MRQRETNARIALFAWCGWMLMLLLATCNQARSAELVQSVARVWLTEGGKNLGGGTGTLIEATETHGIVLTCQHVVGDREGKQVVVEFARDSSYPAEVLEERSGVDIAILKIERPGVLCRRVNFQPPKLKQRVWQSGYGHTKVGPRQTWGHVSHLGRTNFGRYFCASPTARSGDSGGPVLNESGEVVGVIWGTWQADLAGAGDFAKGERAAWATPLSDNQWIKKYLQVQ